MQTTLTLFLFSRSIDWYILKYKLADVQESYNDFCDTPYVDPYINPNLHVIVIYLWSFLNVYVQSLLYLSLFSTKRFHECLINVIFT